MKYCAISLASIIYLLAFLQPAAAYFDPRTVPNNKVGLHILDPNEVSQVPAFVNSNGGDWGYVTVPIQPSDRDHDKWQQFLKNCRDLHLIPIVRITTIPFGGTWETGRDTDLVDFANFLGELSWPVGNRYIVLFNEVNRDTEWGGQVNPSAYAHIVKNAYVIFKERNADFFLLGPALDDALPNSATSMTSQSYLAAMQKEDPAVWSYLDGWAAHSYPNPGFSAKPTTTGWKSIVSYKTALSSFHIADKPVFITETGWDQTKVNDRLLDSYWRQAFIKWSQDNSVVAVTPYVLQGGAQYAPLSFLSPSGDVQPSGRIVKDIGKTSGSPVLAGPQPTPTPLSADDLSHVTEGDNNLSFRTSTLTIHIENIFRKLFGLLPKQIIHLGTDELTVELAENAQAWEKGLSDRPSLDTGTGMLFVFPRLHVPLFWMKDMKFPLDMIWIKDDTVVGIEKNVPVPAGGEKLPTYSPKIPVDKVLEVPAGYSDANGITEGTKLIQDN